jgi:hypothetical protein
MTVAYCVAAHTRPSQCRRLIRRLLDDDPQCSVLLHYDQRQWPLDLRQVAGDRVHVIRERPVYWGSNELVDVYLEMTALAIEKGASYVVMLSGQDYPLRHLGALEAELSAYDVWADTRPLFGPDGTCNWPEARRRYSYRWWHLDNPARLTRGVERVVAGALRVPTSRSELPLPYLVRARAGNQVWWGTKSRGPGMPIYAGSVLMSLSARAVDVITSAPRHATSFFHHVPVAAEACFHTIVRNDTSLTFAPGDARYMRWNEGRSHPEVLTASDLDNISASGAHFGRKFDEAVDSSVLDRLDSLSRLVAPRQ